MPGHLWPLALDILSRVLLKGSLTAYRTEVVSLPHILRLGCCLLLVYLHTTDGVYRHYLSPPFLLLNFVWLSLISSHHRLLAKASCSFGGDSLKNEEKNKIATGCDNKGLGKS